jgi:hypothetical protein
LFHSVHLLSEIFLIKLKSLETRENTQDGIDEKFDTHPPGPRDTLAKGRGVGGAMGYYY